MIPANLSVRLTPIDETFTILATKEFSKVSAETNETINAIWAEEKKRRGEGLFDGTQLTMVEFDETASTLQAALIPYRYYVAQHARRELFGVLGIRSIGVSGVVLHRDQVLFGKRADFVTQTPGLWELVPSGGLNKESLSSAMQCDFRGQILTELEEETGIPRGAVSSLRPFALAEDLIERSVDVGIELRLDSALSTEALADHQRTRSNEYAEQLWVPKTQVEDFLKSKQKDLVRVSVALLLALMPDFQF